MNGDLKGPAEPPTSPPVGTNLSVGQHFDGAVVQPQLEEALRVGVEQQRERRLIADVLGQQQRTGAWQLVQVTVERHCELIRHQQCLV